MTGTSPPGPLRCGSTTCKVKAAATAASNALPPWQSRMSSASPRRSCAVGSVPGWPIAPPASTAMSTAATLSFMAISRPVRLAVDTAIRTIRSKGIGADGARHIAGLGAGLGRLRRVGAGHPVPRLGHPRGFTHLRQERLLAVVLAPPAGVIEVGKMFAPAFGKRTPLPSDVRGGANSQLVVHDPRRNQTNGPDEILQRRSQSLQGRLRK